MKRDHVATELELSGRNIPEALLPSYAHSLARMGITVSEPVPHHTPLEAEEPTLTDAQQQQWEEQQMRQAHEKDQQNPTELDQELKG
jgi:predicted flavoprotein YhiN